MKISIKLECPEQDITKSWELAMFVNGYVIDLVKEIDGALIKFEIKNSRFEKWLEDNS